MKFEVGLEADFYGVDCNCFKLDNCVFEAVEDESDGYRSMMSDVRMKDDTTGLIFFKTPVARVRVVGYDQRTKEDYPLNHTIKGPAIKGNQPVYVQGEGPHKNWMKNEVLKSNRTRLLKLLP